MIREWWTRLTVQLNQTIGRDILHALRWQYLLNIGTGLFGALYIVSAGRILGVEEFGIYALCLAIPTFANALFDARLQEVAIYLSANMERDEFRTSTACLFLTDLLMKVSAAVLSMLIGYILNLTDYFTLESILIISSSFAVFSGKIFNSSAMGLLRLSGNLHFFSILQVADWSCRLSALGLLAFLGYASIFNLLISQAAIGALFNFLVVRKSLVTIQQTPLSIVSQMGDLPDFLRAQSRIIFGSQSISAMDSVVKELDVLVCGIFLSGSQVGAYKMAKSMAAVAWRFADPVYIVVLPKLAQLYSQEDVTRLTKFTIQMTLGLAMLGLALLIASIGGVWLFGPLLLGSEYMLSIKLFPFGALWIAVALPLIWTHSLSIGAGRPDIQIKAVFAGNGIGLAALLMGSAYFALPGALMGLSIAYCLPFVFSFVLISRNRVVQWWS